MMAFASCWHVNRNELTPGGICAAISAIRSSAIGPGPLGIADTSPSADAPCSIASQASSMLAIQQIFTRGFSVGFIFSDTFPQLLASYPRHSGVSPQSPAKLKHNSAKEKDQWTVCVAGILPVRIEVPRSGRSYRFVRPLVLGEETRITFQYKSK